jgi:putative toxin-antitoxin system antitoxin component (TIGR02293 family)
MSHKDKLNTKPTIALAKPKKEKTAVSRQMQSAFLRKVGITINVHDSFEQIALVKKGLSKTVFTNTMQATGLSLQQMAAILHTTDRTLRRFTHTTILSTEHSEKLMQLILLYDKGVQVYDNIATFNNWLTTELTAIGGVAPSFYLDTTAGIQLLHSLLGRIQYGIYS